MPESIDLTFNYAQRFTEGWSLECEARRNGCTRFRLEVSIDPPGLQLLALSA